MGYFNFFFEQFIKIKMSKCQENQCNCSQFIAQKWQKNKCRMCFHFQDKHTILEIQLEDTGVETNIIMADQMLNQWKVKKIALEKAHKNKISTKNKTAVPAPECEPLINMINELCSSPKASYRPVRTELEKILGRRLYSEEKELITKTLENYYMKNEYEDLKKKQKEHKENAMKVSELHQKLKLRQKKEKNDKNRIQQQERKKEESKKKNGYEDLKKKQKEHKENAMKVSELHQ